MNSKVGFIDEKLKREFEKLKTIKQKEFYKQLIKAFENLEENAFCGIHIPKRLIPKEYEKRFGKITNLWKYNLPGAWRLLYSIESNQLCIISIILEWIDHKTYEKRFKY